MRTRRLIVACLAILGAEGVPSAALAQTYAIPARQARTFRRQAAPGRPPVVYDYPPSTYRAYTMPANPRQIPSRYDYIEYDARRPRWSFDNNLWMQHNY